MIKDRYKPYVVEGWVKVTVKVNCVIWEDSSERAIETIRADIEYGDFAGDYNITEDNFKLSAILTSVGDE
jgi:hypothetical protein